MGYSQTRSTHRLLRRNPPIDPQPGGPPTAGTCSIPTCREDVVVPGCGQPQMPFCDVQMVTGVLRDLAAAALTGNTLQMAPRRTNYFQALHEKLEVIDSANPDVNRRCEIQSIEINRIPQEPFSDTVSATNTAAALSDFFGPAFLEYGKPVAYGIYAQAALIYVFTYGLFNIEAVPVDVYAAHFGNALDSIPPFLTIGQPFNQ